MQKKFDILICGAGLVGSSLAIALSALPLQIGVIEAFPLKTVIDPQYDGRTLALTYGSSRILQAIGAWDELMPSTSAINTVHISHRGHFGKARINAKDENVPALGYAIPAAMLGVTLNKTLLHTVSTNDNIHFFNPAKVIAMQADAQGWELQIETAGVVETVHARLVIAADGTHSTIRQLQDIPVEQNDYHQSAIATTLVATQSHQHVAYERFIEQGALALLPLQGLRNAMIWSGDNAQINTLMTLSDEEFLQRVQTTFGYRLGNLTQLGKRHVYPLQLMYAKQQLKPGLVLIGNAAHTLHPIAAQGFNLGLKDVALLAQIIADAVRSKQDFAAWKVLQSYIEGRENDQQRMITFTDNLTRLFAYEFLPLNFLSSSALLTLDIVPSLKHQLAKRLMGTQGRLSNLARGLPL